MENLENSPAWKNLKRHILSAAAVIISIDNGDVFYNRSAFVSSITGKITRQAENGNKDLVKMAVDLVNELNARQKKPVISKKCNIFNL